MEIITEPDFRSADEATAFVKELQLILQTIGTCDGKMEEGSLRVDASVSIHRPGDPLGTRSEVKNVNSINALSKAINFEIIRQTEVVESGGEVVNETRGFDVDSGETVPMRDKERLHDYRFMAEPNLPPLRLYTSQTIPAGVPADQIVNVDELQALLPELPNIKRSRLQQTYGLSLEHCIALMSEPGLVECYEEAVAANRGNAKVAVNICINDIFAALKKQGVSFQDSGLTSDHIRDLTDLVASNVISVATVRKVVDHLIDDTGKTPQQIVAENNWSQVSDDAVLEQVCRQVLGADEKAVVDYKRGKTKVFKYFIGQVQKEMKGRADGKAVSDILKRLLDS